MCCSIRPAKGDCKCQCAGAVRNDVHAALHIELPFQRSAGRPAASARKGKQAPCSCWCSAGLAQTPGQPFPGWRPRATSSNLLFSPNALDRDSASPLDAHPCYHCCPRSIRRNGLTHQRHFHAFPSFHGSISHDSTPGRNAPFSHFATSSLFPRLLSPITALQTYHPVSYARLQASTVIHALWIVFDTLSAACPYLLDSPRFSYSIQSSPRHLVVTPLFTFQH